MFLSPITCLGQAPPIEWKKNFGGTNNDEAEKIIITGDGGYLMVGWTYSVDGDAVGNHGNNNTDCWIIKMDPTGNIQWKKMIGGTAWDDALSVDQTKDGGYIIAGHSESRDGDLNDNHGIFIPDALVIRIDANGNIIWTRNLGGTDYDAFLSIKQTSDGGFIAAGYTGSTQGDVSGNHGDYDAWIVKLDDTGRIQWQKCIGGTDRDNAWSIIPSADGGYIFTGHGKSANGDIQTGHGGFDIMTGKLDASGNLIWLKTFGGSSQEWSTSIVSSPDGGYLVAGYSSSSDGDVINSYGLNDIWLIKIDEMGNQHWQKSYGGTNFEDPYEIIQTLDGGYAIAGRTLSTDGDISSTNGGNDYWILKVDVSGNLQWQQTYGGAQQDIAHSIKQTADGGFIIAGTSYSNDGDVGMNRGRSDAWIIKLGICALNTPIIKDSIIGNITPCSGRPTTYRIDKMADATGYTWKIPDGWSIVSGQGSDSVTVIPGTNAGSLSVIAYNSCKSSVEKNQPIVPLFAALPVPTIISDAGNSICQDAIVSFTVDVDSTFNPIFRWKKNGLQVGKNATVYRDSMLTNEDRIWCEIASVNQCGDSVIIASPEIKMSVTPSVNSAIVIASTTTSICKGTSLEFIATATGGGSSPIFKWYVNDVPQTQDGATFSSASFSNQDVVTCRLTSGELCAVLGDVISNPITLSVDSAITAAVFITASDTTVCANDRIFFQAQTDYVGLVQRYDWKVNNVSTGESKPSFSTKELLNDDEVTCILTPGGNTCASKSSASNPIKITINPLPSLTVTAVDTIVPLGTQVNLNVDLSEPVHSFNWSPADWLINPLNLQPITAPIISPVTFRLNITTKDGCLMSREISIKPRMVLAMPNAFTPNGDGKNDVFKIPALTGLVLTRFSIYNRWGGEVFTTTDVDFGWDGRSGGIGLSSGSYVYKIIGSQNGKPVLLTGAFTLLR